MAALYSHTTRATGTILTAAIYNADHENHITYGDAQYLGGWSANAAGMQAQTDPGEQGSESLATSIADEIERLRFALTEIKQALDASVTYWYETPNRLDISGVPPLPAWYIQGLDIDVYVSDRGRFYVATGICRSADNVMNLRVTIPLDRTATAQWTTGASGGRGLGTTLGNKAPIHFFVFKTAASTIDIGCDSVLTASNLMARASATHYRRIGSNHTGTGGNLCAHSQRDGYVYFVDPVVDINPTFAATFVGSTTPALARLPRTPTAFRVLAHVAVGNVSSAATSIFLRLGNGLVSGANEAIGAGYIPLMYVQAAGGGLPAHHIGHYWTSPSGSISFALHTATGGARVGGHTLGWWDPRRE